MNGFALPLAAFTVINISLLVAMFWHAWDDDIPERAAMTWAVTCPLAGLFFGIGLAPLALVLGAVSVLALCSLAYWYLASPSEDGGEEAEEPVQPGPGPTDDVEPPRDDDPDHTIDWDQFDRERAGWERLPERV